MIKRNILGITSGDPAGIGPEITVKALASQEVYRRCIPLVLGSRAVLEDVLYRAGLTLKLREAASPADAVGEYGTIDFLDVGLPGRRGEGWNYGEVSAAAGEAAFRYVERAVGLALEKKIAGIVTGPINKEAINRAGHHYAGHTEILADLTGSKNYAMLLCSGKLRVVHVTTHTALRTAADLITVPRILSVLRLAHKGLAMLGCSSPRIAVAGFNPHASEGGLFGDEEQRVIIPAIEAARAEKIDALGPIPPDTVFVKALGGYYDAVAAMYHDQGHIPLKLAGFRMDPVTQQFTQMSGVNCTLGLPVIRTSVDHGTAFDRAGKNSANEQSMIEAIEMAAVMAEQ